MVGWLGGRWLLAALCPADFGFGPTAQTHTHTLSYIYTHTHAHVYVNAFSETHTSDKESIWDK